MRLLAVLVITCALCQAALAQTPNCKSIPDPAARGRLVARYDHGVTQPEYATGYRWDIVVCGGHRTWTADDG